MATKTRRVWGRVVTLGFTTWLSGPRVDMAWQGELQPARYRASYRSPVWPLHCEVIWLHHGSHDKQWLVRCFLHWSGNQQINQQWWVSRFEYRNHVRTTVNSSNLRAFVDRLTRKISIISKVNNKNCIQPHKNHKTPMMFGIATPWCGQSVMDVDPTHEQKQGGWFNL